jgi:hypothetical protein
VFSDATEAWGRVSKASKVVVKTLKPAVCTMRAAIAYDITGMQRDRWAGAARRSPGPDYR